MPIHSEGPPIAQGDEANNVLRKHYDQVKRPHAVALRPQTATAVRRAVPARVGRTARAGCKGSAVTIAKKGQVKQFLRMRAEIDGRRVRADRKLEGQACLERLADRYRRCLEDLKEVMEAERTGELDPSAPIVALDENDDSRLDDGPSRC